MATSNKHLTTHLYLQMDWLSRHKSASGLNISRQQSFTEKTRNTENTPLLNVKPNQSLDSQTGKPRLGKKMVREQDDNSSKTATSEVAIKEKCKRKLWRSSKVKYDMKYEDFLKPLNYWNIQPPLEEERPLDRRRTQGKSIRTKEGAKELKRSSSAACSSETPKQQHCFIVPSHSVDRFMPFRADSEDLKIIEVQNQKMRIVFDFGENAALSTHDCISPATTLVTPSREWISTQLDIQRQKFNRVRESKTATEGMLLINVERCSQFPFMTYLVLNTNDDDPKRLVHQLQDCFTTFQSKDQLQHLAEYEEVVTIARPPFDVLPKIPATSKTGYIVSTFRVLPGEDREKLERNWLTWTGASHLCKKLPGNLGLRRITFHKTKQPHQGITYVLLCECGELMDYVTEACVYVDQLRARCCGYTAFFKVVEKF
ncbi:uncharacterized protein LOC143253570 isoform X1 [Tachypleus tridentatus]|uniref:uncharacterized protein LOC143253570 isoform X1 n=1 Tax=Tachypleus tridentatus TaxID=6853 RepID=UPI003FD24A90